VVKKASELRVELLLGRKVRDVSGRVVGRLEEFRARRNGEAWEVTEFDLGPTALLERLAVRHFSAFVPGRRPAGYRASWDQIDLSDPIHPRLTVAIEQLTAIRRR
jgi:hypothetical protein